MWAERGAEHAKYSRSTELTFIQKPAQSLCLALVPLWHRSPVPSTINKTVSLHFKNRSLWRRDGVREIFLKANRQVIEVHNSCQKKKQSRNKPAPPSPRRLCVPGVGFRLKRAGVRHAEEFYIWASVERYYENLPPSKPFDMWLLPVLMKICQ